MVRSNKVLRGLGLVGGAFLLGILCLVAMTGLAWIPGVKMPLISAGGPLMIVLVAFWMGRQAGNAGLGFLLGASAGASFGLAMCGMQTMSNAIFHGWQLFMMMLSCFALPTIPAGLIGLLGFFSRRKF